MMLAPAVLLATVGAGMAPGPNTPAIGTDRIVEASTIHDPDLRAARRGDLDLGPRFRDERAGLVVRVDGQPIPYRYMAVTAVPGEELVVEVEVGDPAAAAPVELRYAAGSAAAASSGKWIWKAPDAPGIVALLLGMPEGDRLVHLNVLVVHPRSHVVGGNLHGYQIGQYREKPLRGDPVYLPPAGFVEVDSAQSDVLVSPHFTLGQFLCKQLGSPSYLALSMPLVVKLEAVLAGVNEAGRAVSTLAVMSGFRTPAYNAAIGNKTVYSRHLWGDAADFFVDADNDGYIDDLDADGRVGLSDARWLSRIVDRVERHSLPGLRSGGVGVYRANATHGPFVHVDARGYAARW
jgi:hypothetical protein